VRPPPLPPRPQRGILKQKRSVPDLPMTSTDANAELTNRHTRCENCKLGTGPALTPTVSQDAAMSELIARLHAAEIAAEVEALQPDTYSGIQQCVLGQICCRCRSTGDQTDDSASKEIGGEACHELSNLPADHESVIPISREHSERCQKYHYARNDATVCSDSNCQAVNCEYDGSGLPSNTDQHAGKHHAARSPQSKVSRAPAPDCEISLGLDGVVEEAKAERPRAVERRSRQKPITQVASRIRELELKNAIPMPHHFRPAGHTRHDKDNSTHRSQLHRDEKPNVDLIFPLHVRRFPRRNSDASPLRPETPLHHSIPEEEPYIHAPQPARSMPMLKDPPEYDSHPHAEPEPLDTSRGNNDSFAVASRYGRRASKNFAVRRNSRP
jgi:hypothetical protein